MQPPFRYNVFGNKYGCKLNITVSKTKMNIFLKNRKNNFKIATSSCRKSILYLVEFMIFF